MKTFTIENQFGNLRLIEETTKESFPITYICSNCSLNELVALKEKINLLQIDSVGLLTQIDQFNLQLDSAIHFIRLKTDKDYKMNDLQDHLNKTTHKLNELRSKYKKAIDCISFATKITGEISRINSEGGAGSRTKVKDLCIDILNQFHSFTDML